MQGEGLESLPGSNLICFSAFNLTTVSYKFIEEKETGYCFPNFSPFYSTPQNFRLFGHQSSGSGGFWIRIRIDLKCWIGISTETNADPQH